MKFANSRWAVRAVPWLLAVSQLGECQQQSPTGSTSLHPDGLSMGAATATTAKFNTVTISGVVTTFRSIPTLDPSIDETPPLLPNIYDPMAVNAQSVCPGYTVMNQKNNEYGFTATLQLAGKACNVYGTDVQTLNLLVQYQSKDRLAVIISPAHLDSSNTTQYVIPPAYVQEPMLGSDAKSAMKSSDLSLTWSNSPSWGFKITRKSTGDVLFNTEMKKIVFENQFVEFVTSMPANYNLYGLAETVHGLRLGNNFTRTIWPADAGDALDRNIYGSHPIYYDTRYYEKGSYGKMSPVMGTTYDASKQYVSYTHGVYLRNTHGQEILMNPTNVTWRTLGGSIELYFFSGPQLKDVLNQYQTGAVGYPAMQQYFTFGYHQCRWGYANWSELQSVVDNFRRFDIPLENIWTDIDYMKQYRDFDNDPVTFPYAEAKTFLSKLHSTYQHYIPIVDSAIYHPDLSNKSDAYGTYVRGHADQAFIENVDGSEYIGDVWPGYTVFPDWRSPKTADWWTHEFLTWYNSGVSFSGIWIDMSEASSFCVGSCGTGMTGLGQVHPPFLLPGQAGNIDYRYPEAFNVTNKTEAASAVSASMAQASRISATMTMATTTQPYLRTTPTPNVRNVTYPPYVINNVNGALGVHALSPDARHADGTEEYDMHGLFGHEILNATYNALLAVFPGKRPFIIGRSTFAGSGRFAGHWQGDNVATWADMYFTIPAALTMSLSVIPMFGADTCGFAGNTDMELCNRWMQLSAFFPFYRNHNTLAAPSQEPYIWSSVITATKTAMNIRYSLLPYIYTLFYHAHTNGASVMRALAWEFPADPSLSNADRQFFLGPSILVTPVLEPLARKVSGVFPGSQGSLGLNGGKPTRYYDWYTHAEMMSGGKNVSLAAPLGTINVHVRGGSVLPLQAPGYTTTESRRNDWSVLAALDSDGAGMGTLYLDDGESLMPNATKLVNLAASTSGSMFKLSSMGTGSYMTATKLDNVTVIGYTGPAPTMLKFNGKTLPNSCHAYDSSKKVLSITQLASYTPSGAWTSNWELTAM